MKYVEKYLKEVVKVKPLGELTTREDVVGDLSGEMVYIDGKCSDIFISHADYANWLEKQGDVSSLVEEIKRIKDLLLREKENAVSVREKLSLGGRVAMLEELLAFTLNDWVVADSNCAT